MSFCCRFTQGAYPIFAGLLLLGVSACSMKGWQPASTSAFKIQFAPSAAAKIERYDLSRSMLRMLTSDPLVAGGALGVNDPNIDYACLMVDVVKQNEAAPASGTENYTQLTFGEFLNAGNRLISQDDYLNSADGTPGIPAEWRASLAKCTQSAACSLRVWAVRPQVGDAWGMGDGAGTGSRRLAGSRHDSFTSDFCDGLSTDPITEVTGTTLDPVTNLPIPILHASNPNFVFNYAPFPTIYFVASAPFRMTAPPAVDVVQVIEAEVSNQATTPYNNQSHLVGLGHLSGYLIAPIETYASADPSTNITAIDFDTDLHFLNAAERMLNSEDFTFNMRGSLKSGIQFDACNDSMAHQPLSTHPAGYPKITFTDVDSSATPYTLGSDVVAEELTDGVQLYTRNHIRISSAISSALPAGYSPTSMSPSPLYLLIDNGGSDYCTGFDRNAFTYTLAPTIVLRPPGTP